MQATAESLMQHAQVLHLLGK